MPVTDLTINEVRNIGYNRRAKAVDKKLMPWIYMLLVVFLICAIILMVVIESAPPRAYQIPGEGTLYYDDGFWFEGEKLQSERARHPPVFWVVLSLFLSTIVVGGGLIIWRTSSAENYKNRFVQEWLDSGGTTKPEEEQT